MYLSTYSRHPIHCAKWNLKIFQLGILDKRKPRLKSWACLTLSLHWGSSTGSIFHQSKVWLKKGLKILWSGAHTLNQREMRLSIAGKKELTCGLPLSRPLEICYSCLQKETTQGFLSSPKHFLFANVPPHFLVKHSILISSVPLSLHEKGSPCKRKG